MKCHRCAAALLLLAAGALHAEAGPLDFLFTSGNPPAAEVSRDTQRVWKVGEYSALRLLPREGASPANQHPAQAGADVLRGKLAAVEFVTRAGAGTALFAADEVAELAPALSQALAAAGPGDDLVLLSTSRREKGFLSPPLSVTARLFVQEGALNLIVAESRLDALSAFRAAHIVPTLNFGSRATASAVSVRSGAALARRPDWLALPLAAADAAGLPAKLSSQAQSAAPATAAATSPATAVEAASPRVRDAAFYEAQGQRLKGLLRLREQGLLTEEEFLQKRRDILQSL